MHQEANARLLERSGAASVILDGELSGELLAATIVSLVGDADRLDKMSESSRGLGGPDASHEIAMRLVELCCQKGRLSRLAAVLGELCSVR
jgi:UDP-N-acetylglucosamine--N-acetylmuramyl-(pentapeptide) pyrophosphoryl-undecaprenol N-acetylglucosamine transferase